MRWATMAAMRYRWARSRSRDMTGRCRYGSWDRLRRDQMQRRYITVDVFTDRAFGGNPLAVVLDAGKLSTAQMQAIATEFNYSETTFVLATQAAKPPARLMFEEIAGLVPVEIQKEGGKVSGAELTAPQPLKRL